MNERIIRNSADAYFSNAVIKTPHHLDTRLERVVIDSRERNISLFPNPNQYEIAFADDILHVKSIRLLSSAFPFVSYLINNNNNLIHFAIGATTYTATVSIGNYTTTTLAAAIESALNTAVGNTWFKVEYNSVKDNYKIRCNTAFGLIFTGQTFTHPTSNGTDIALISGSIGKVIGFGIANYISQTQVTGDAFVNVIESEFRKNFEIDNYMILKLDSIELNKNTTKGINASFAIIGKTLSTHQQYDLHQYYKSFTQPIGRLTKLRISITDFYGNLYDFQNYDHRFELLIESQPNPM